MDYSYESTVEAYKDGKVELVVDRVKAHRVVDQWMPNRYRIASSLWGWVSIILVLVSIPAVFIWGLLAGFILLASGISVFSATKKSNYQFVIKYALENKDFFDHCLQHNIIKIVKSSDML